MGEQLKLLIVDPERLLASALQRALGRRPEIEVLPHLASNVAEALPATGFLRPDILLLEYRMDQPAPEAIPQFRARAPGCKVIVYSWLFGAGEVEATLAAGAVGFLPKSISVEELGEAVIRAHRGEGDIGGAAMKRITSVIRERAAAAGEAWERLAELTPRERLILRMLGLGASVEAISRQMGISATTVRKHAQNILDKTHLHSQIEAIAMARVHGYIQI